jgi:hypothetical protein
VAFLATLLESRVRFQAVDLPAADEFTLHILAAVAQKEASAISSRTRDELAAKKARGFTLGTPANLTEEAKQKSLVARQTNAQTNVNIGRPPSWRRYCGLRGPTCGPLLSSLIRRVTLHGGGRLFIPWACSAYSPPKHAPAKNAGTKIKGTAPTRRSRHTGAAVTPTTR